MSSVRYMPNLHKLEKKQIKNIADYTHKPI